MKTPISFAAKISTWVERADVIAQAMPNRPDAIHRVRAGVIYVLRHNLHNGHTCIPREKLLTPSRDLLNTDTDTIEIALDGLLEDRQLVSKTIGSREFIFLPSVYSAEKSAAERIRIMLRFPCRETGVGKGDSARRARKRHSI